MNSSAPAHVGAAQARLPMTAFDRQVHIRRPILPERDILRAVLVYAFQGAFTRIRADGWLSPR